MNNQRRKKLKPHVWRQVAFITSLAVVALSLHSDTRIQGKARRI